MPVSYPITLPSSPAPRALDWAPLSSVARFASPFTFRQQVQAHAGQLWQVRIEYPSMADDVAEQWIAALLSLNGMQGTFFFGDSVRKTPRGTAGGTPLVAGAGQTGQLLVTDGWPAFSLGVLLKGDWIQLGGAAVAPFTGTPDWLTDLYISERGSATIKISFSDACPTGGGNIDWKMGDLVDTTAVAEDAISVTLNHNLGLGASRAHKVLKDVDSDAAGGAVIDIWPRLRESPSDNEPLILSNTKATFRMKDNVMDYSVNVLKRYGFEIEAVEAI